MSTTKSISLLLLLTIISSAVIVLAQDQHFTVKSFDTSKNGLTYTTAVELSYGYALSYERDVDIFPLNFTNGEPYTVDNFKVPKGDTIGVSSTAVFMDTLYSISTTYIMVSHLNLSTINTFGYNTTQISSTGAFAYSNTPGQAKIFVLSPSSSNVYYFDFDPTPITSGDGEVIIKNLGNIALSSFGPNWGYALDSNNGKLFVGDDNGKIVTINLNSRVIENTFTPANSTTRQVGTVDSNRNVLYFCSKGTDGQLSMDIFNYTTTTLVHESSHQIDSLLDCRLSAYDPSQGQVFFVGPSSDSLAIIGLSHDGLNFATYNFDSNIDSEPTSIILHSNIQELLVFTSNRMSQVEYKSNCPNDCYFSNGQGVCEMGVCVCDVNYNGTDCGSKLCLGELNNCSGHGTCSNGFCLCEDNYMTVANCSVEGCFKNCSNHGICHTNNQATNPALRYTCQCTSDYSGEYCQNTAPPAQCHTITTKSDCIDRSYCGWCVSTDTCQLGNQYGPVVGFCREWFYGEDVEIGVVVLAAIFIALISILFLIDMLTTIPLDISRAKNYEVEFRTGTYPKASHEEASVLWWRDQRSAKAWTLMDQFQYVSLISHMGVVFPSRFLNFTEYLDWTNLGIPFPESIRDKIVTPIFSSRNSYDAIVNSGTTRSLMTYAQYNNILETTSTYHLANILFWFIILAAAFIVPLLLAFIILNFIESLVHWKEVIRNRLIHCTVRILQFSYIGVISAAAFSIVAKPLAAKTIVPGAILIVLYGIGFPAAIWFILKVPESRLHNPTFKQQFGCLYVNFKPKTDHRFVVFSYIKRFIMAVIIGILAFNIEPEYPLSGQAKAVPIAQCVVICVVIALYVVLLAIRKPYFDHYHLWLEYLLAVLNIVSVGVCLSHLKEPSVAGELVVCVLQALALVACIAAYFISWLQMRSKFLTKITNVLCCCCKGNDKTKKNEHELH